MATSDPLEILLAHDHWASRKLLEACQTLDEDQFQQRFEMGPGSLHDTVTHMLGAMRGWGDMLAGREQRARLDQDGQRRTPAELLELLEDVCADLKASAQNYSPDAWVSGSRGGRTFTFLRGGVLTHVATHGMHHRAQCLNMLRQLGVAPLPPSSVLEWMLMVDLQE